MQRLGRVDWALTSLPAGARRPLILTVADWISFSFFPIGLQTAVVLSHHLGFRGYCLISFLGSAILAITSAASGYVAQKTGLSFGLMSRLIFGRFGYLLPCAIVPVGLIGWDSFNLALQSDFTVGLFHLGSKWYIPLCFIYMLLFGFGAVAGFKWIARIAVFAAPAMSIFLLYGVALSVTRTGKFTGLWPTDPIVHSVSFAQGLTAVVGLFALGASVSSPDIQRFCRSGKDAILTAVYAFGIAFPLHLLAGAVCGLATGETSIAAAFARLGATALGFILLFILSWTVVHNDYYSASLGLASLLKHSRPLMATVAALVAACIAATDLQGHLIQWLTLMSTIATPLAGLIVADFFFNQRFWYRDVDSLRSSNEIVSKRPWRLDSYVSWFLGAATVYVTNKFGVMIPPLNGIIVAFLSQAAFAAFRPSESVVR